MSKPLSVTFATGDDTRNQTCAHCLDTIRKGEPRNTETFTWEDGSKGGALDIRRFHYHTACKPLRTTKAQRAYRPNPAKAPEDVRLICECGGMGNPANRCGECGARIVEEA